MRPTIFSLAAIAGVLYYLTSLFSPVESPQKAVHKPAADVRVVRLTNARVLHNVAVTRCDPDGLVVSCAEGTFKVWNRLLTPEDYAKLKQGAPVSTPSPKFNSLLDAPKPSPSPKGSKDSVKTMLKELF